MGPQVGLEPSLREVNVVWALEAFGGRCQLLDGVNLAVALALLTCESFMTSLRFPSLVDSKVGLGRLVNVVLGFGREESAERHVQLNGPGLNCRSRMRCPRTGLVESFRAPRRSCSVNHIPGAI